MITIQKPSSRRFFNATFLLLFLFFPSFCLSQTEDISNEIVLGLNYRSSILENYPEVRGTSEDILAQNVFRRLITTSVSKYAPPLPYNVTVINSETINAFATEGGQVYVPLGMARLLGEEEGLWAAVLGHEIGHNMGRHHYKTYLRQLQLREQIDYYRQRAAQGDTNANWTLLGLQIAGGIANKKLSRDDEHEADKLGLMMMVEAGYHPAFAITLYRRLRMKLGDESKFSAFFSSHPRWTTREDRAIKVYDESVSLFESRWPDAASSPGGPPPGLASIGEVRVTQDKQEKAVRIVVPYNVRNGRNLPINAVAFFTLKKNPVAASLPEFQTKDGYLIGAEQLVPKSSNENGTITIKVPSAALGIKDRKLKAVILLGYNGEMLEISKEISVSFPKL